MGRKNIKLAVLVGAGIAARRKKMGMTQAQLAGILSITQDSLSRMESGIIAPKFSRLSDIASTLGCSVADLFKTASPEAQRRSEAIAEMIQELPEEFQDVLDNLVANAVAALKDCKK